MSPAYRPSWTMYAKVSLERLGISESGSSKRSSIQVPPFTAAPVVGVEVDEVAPPQALRIRMNTAKKEKEIVRKRGLGLLSIVSSYTLEILFRKHGYPP